MRAENPPDITGLTFVGKLGSGGYADVFLYDQATPQRKVAVKVLRETGLSAAAKSRFTAEADAMARLEHPYIVPVYATGTTLDHRPYIAMMYYPRPSLAERARTERFSVAETLQLGIQLGSAVETAHRAGLLHRDIKPANVLTSAYGRPGLTDFGIAGQMSDKDEDDVGVSVPWSPPETLYATAPASVRSDVYSLAATLWHLLVGRSPFEVVDGDNTPFALMRRIRDVPAPTTGRTDVPAAFDRLLRAAMGKDAALRPASAMEFVGAMQAIEQELRLPRTPLELANTDPDAVARRASATVDRTQVRSPQVISPSTGLPPAAQGDLDSGAAVTRRSNRRVAPVVAYEESVDGSTVLRAAGPTAPEGTSLEPSATGGGAWARRALVIALAVIVAAVIGVVAWQISTAPPPVRPQPSVSVSPEQPQIDQAAPAPGRPDIRCVRRTTSVTCSWTYANRLTNDQYDWRIWNSTQRNQTDKPQAVIADAPQGVCIEVKVYRFDGSYAPAEWTKGCE